MPPIDGSDWPDYAVRPHAGDSTRQVAFTHAVAGNSGAGFASAQVGPYRSVLFAIIWNYGGVQTSQSTLDLSVTWDDAGGSATLFRTKIYRIPSSSAAGVDGTFFLRIPTYGNEFVCSWALTGAFAAAVGDLQISTWLSSRECRVPEFNGAFGSLNDNLAAGNNPLLWANNLNYIAAQARSAWSLPWSGKARLVARTGAGGGAITVLASTWDGTNSFTLARLAPTGVNIEAATELLMPDGPVWITATKDATPAFCTVLLTGETR